MEAFTWSWKKLIHLTNAVWQRALTLGDTGGAKVLRPAGKCARLCR